LSKIRRIDFSPDEWLAGTIEISDADRGIYITICALIWSRGGRITEELVRRHSCSHGNAIAASISRLEKAGKIVRNGLEIGQKRAENELETAQKRLEKASENGTKGNKIRWNGVTTRSQGNIANHQPSTINHHNKKEDSPNGESKKNILWNPSPDHYRIAEERGYDERWVADQAERYCDWLANTKRRHKDRDRGFRNWIKTANEQRSANGHAGQKKPSAVDSLYEGAARAVAAREARRRAAEPPNGPLLDC